MSDTPGDGPWFRYRLVLVPEANVRGTPVESPLRVVVDGGVPYEVVAGIGASSPERARRFAGLRQHDPELEPEPGGLSCVICLFTAEGDAPPAVAVANGLSVCYDCLGYSQGGYLSQVIGTAREQRAREAAS